MKTSIYDLSRASLAAFFASIGSPAFRATQVFEGLYRDRVRSFADITTLKKEFREQLADVYDFPDLAIVTEQTASDGTHKFLFALPDEARIETVLLKANYGYSVCVTSEVGCNMGCAFCASGTLHKVRNLLPGEMVLQVMKANEYLAKIEPGARVDHVVVMGIGEPFDNYDNVLEFLRIINDDHGLEIGARHITVSTCGLVPKIREFASFPLQVNLAISLHFASDEKRARYMPVDRSYPLPVLLAALHDYVERTGRRVTLEYILLSGVNDTDEDARALVAIARSLPCYVNLIPYNETGVFKRSTRIEAFSLLLERAGINARQRREQGADIDAACGQLRAKEGHLQS